MPADRSPFRFQAVGTAARVVALAAVLLIASAFRDARIDIVGLRLHISIVVLAFAVPFLRTNLSALQRSVVPQMATFLALFSISALIEGSYAEVIKLATFFIALCVTAMAVRSFHDVVAVTIGLVLCALFLGYRNVQVIGVTAGSYYDETLDGLGNKNAFSLYYLPGILLATWAWMIRPVQGFVRIAVMGSVLFLALTALVGGNRSGWLGVAIIGLGALSWGRSVRVLTALSAAATVIYVAFDRVVTADVFRERWRQTTEGYSSDELREQLFETAVQIGFENPLLGLGPYGLQAELAHRLIPNAPNLDPHNAIGAIIGGAGFLAFAAFIWLVVAMLRAKPEGAPDARWLVRWMTLLWLVRGFFSQETLYSPSFAIGLGTALGYLLHTATVPVGARPPAPATTTPAQLAPR